MISPFNNYININVSHKKFLCFQVKSTMTLVKPNALKHEMLGTNGGKDSVCVREFFQDKMTCVCTVDDVETTRVYKKL